MFDSNLDPDLKLLSEQLEIGLYRPAVFYSTQRTISIVTGYFDDFTANLPDCLKIPICGIWVIVHVLVCLFAGAIIFFKVIQDHSILYAIAAVGFFCVVYIVIFVIGHLICACVTGP